MSPRLVLKRNLSKVLTRALLSGSLLVGSFLYCGCSGERVTQTETDPVLTVGLRWEPRTFNPFYSVDSASFFAQSLIYAGLVRYGSSGEIEPDLASSFAIDESGKVYTFDLRPNLRFSDGSPLTPVDVVRSIKEAAGKRSPFAKNFQALERIVVTGNKIEVRFSGPDVTLLSRFADLKVLPAFALDESNRKRSSLSRQPVGSGPFLIRRWLSGQQINFVRNSHYWDKQPSYRELVWRVIPDKRLLAMALLRKEIDLASLDGREARLLVEEADYLKVERLKGARVVFLGFNTSRWPFNTQAVRQAISMMIDRRKINEKLFGDYSHVPASEFTEAKGGRILFPYDLKRAELKMKEAGFERRKSGWFYVKNPDKEPLSIRVATVTDFSDIGQVVAAYLEKAGVKAEFEIAEYSTLKDQYLKDGKFDTVLFSRSIGPMPDPRMFWSTSGSLNYSRYHSPTMDKLIAYGSSAATLAEKNSYNSRVGDILALESPWIYLARPDLLIVHNQRVKNVVFPGQTKEGLPWNNELLNARLWSISKQ